MHDNARIKRKKGFSLTTERGIIYTMKRRQHSGKMAFRPINKRAINPKETRMEMLYKQIKEIEADNKAKKAEDKVVEIQAKAESHIDENIKQELEPKKVNRKFKVFTTEHQPKKSSVIQYNFTEDHEEPMYYISSDERLQSILSYPQTIAALVEIFENAVEQYSYIMSKVSEADREVQDYLHELRQPKRNAYEGYKLYRLGHDLQVKRQSYKDGADIVRPLSNFVNAHKDMLESLKNISNYLNGLEESRKARIYYPRSNLKLPVGDKFRALSPSDQAKMKEFYENKKRKAS